MGNSGMSTWKLSLLVLATMLLSANLSVVFLSQFEQPAISIANATPISLTFAMFILDLFDVTVIPLSIGLVGLFFIKDGKFRTVFGVFLLQIVTDFGILLYNAKVGYSSKLFAYPVECILTVMMPFIGVYLVANLGRLFKKELSFPARAFIYVVYLIVVFTVMILFESNTR